MSTCHESVFAENRSALGDRCAVLLVDMQDGLVRNADQRALIPRQVRLLETCRSRGIPIVYLELDGASYGRTNRRLLEIIDTFPGPMRKRIGKAGRNGFDGTGLSTALDALSVRTVFITGISSCGCVYETAQEALRRGFSVLTSPDLIAPHCDESDHRARARFLTRERDCPFCADRARWFREHVECVPSEWLVAT